MQLFALSLTPLLLSGCAINTVLSDYCLITNYEDINTLEEAAKFDCLCAEKPEDKDCR